MLIVRCSPNVKTRQDIVSEDELILSFLPFQLQVFTSIQEKAIEAEMVATKDVCMEPTIRSLQEDLVSGFTHQRQDVNGF